MYNDFNIVSFDFTFDKDLFNLPGNFKSDAKFKKENIRVVNKKQTNNGESKSNNPLFG